MLIDTHVHLTDERYEDADAIVRDFDRDGIEKVITIGYDVPSSIGCTELAGRFPRVYAAVGLHPQEAESFSYERLSEIRKAAAHPKVVAIGEIGLDYYYENTEEIKRAQKQMFVSQLELAAELGLPVILHIRDAYGDALEILKQHRDLLSHSGILHCYSGSSDLIRAFLPLGLYVSYSGSITFKNNRKAEECIRNTPKDRILTETDCPYLTPVPHRGEINYPKYVGYVAEKIASVYGIETNELNEIVRQNVERLFGI